MAETPRPRVTRLADLLDEGLTQATAAYEARRDGAALGPAIACSPKLATELCGALPVGLTVLHGPPGSGKSAFAAQLAAEAGCPALIATFEMPPLELLRRQAGRVTNTYCSKFRTGVLAPSEWLTLMRRAAAAAPRLAILDGTRGSVTPADLREAVDAIRGDAPHALLVVDSASAWVRSSGLGGANEYEATSAALASLQALSAELRIAIVVVAEQNRANRGEDRQEASAGSRVYEYGAEVVLALVRDHKALPDVDGAVDVELVLAKNRLGAQGRRIALRFEGGFMRFTEADTVVDFGRGKRRSA